MRVRPFAEKCVDRQLVQELRRMLEQQPDRRVKHRLLADLLGSPVLAL